MSCFIRRIVATTVALLIALAPAGPLRAQAQPLPAPVILIVDLQQILQDAKAAKAVQGVINQEYSSYTKEVAQQEDELQKSRTAAAPPSPVPARPSGFCATWRRSTPLVPTI